MIRKLDLSNHIHSVLDLKMALFRKLETDISQRQEVLGDEVF